MAVLIGIATLAGIVLLAAGGVMSETRSAVLIPAGLIALCIAFAMFAMLVLRYVGTAMSGERAPRRQQRAMPVAMRAERISGLKVIRRSIPEAILWAFVAHLIFNVWSQIFPAAGWNYGYSVIGVVAFLMEQIIAPHWVPLLLGGLTLLALILLAFKFLPLLRAAFRRPLTTTLVAIMVFGLTLGAFELIYFGVTEGGLYWSPAMLLNTVPPLVVATVILAGRAGRVDFAETGMRDVVGQGGDDLVLD